MKWKTRKTRTRKTIVDNLVHNRDSPLDFFWERGTASNSLSADLSVLADVWYSKRLVI